MSNDQWPRLMAWARSRVEGSPEPPTGRNGCNPGNMNRFCYNMSRGGGRSRWAGLREWFNRTNHQGSFPKWNSDLKDQHETGLQYNHDQGGVNWKDLVNTVYRQVEKNLKASETKEEAGSHLWRSPEWNQVLEGTESTSWDDSPKGQMLLMICACVIKGIYQQGTRHHLGNNSHQDICSPVHEMLAQPNDLWQKYMMEPETEQAPWSKGGCSSTDKYQGCGTPASSLIITIASALRRVCPGCKALRVGGWIRTGRRGSQRKSLYCNIKEGRIQCASNSSGDVSSSIWVREEDFGLLLPKQTPKPPSPSPGLDISPTTNKEQDIKDSQPTSDETPNVSSSEDSPRTGEQSQLASNASQGSGDPGKGATGEKAPQGGTHTEQAGRGQRQGENIGQTAERTNDVPEGAASQSEGKAEKNMGTKEKIAMLEKGEPKITQKPEKGSAEIATSSWVDSATGGIIGSTVQDSGATLYALVFRFYGPLFNVHDSSFRVNGLHLSV
ncbi:hypothetical protein C922_05217 [Plasmodium inui San Antonio 1]|uniref:Uncharacterized protein n=1 Tax=Plasmodium inui San Antonio 1 TaxID=1237626 RepID=W7AGF9_9APIC|nr:hypothetical protein C922_05217 [Plasmodium inui San Antonio 1]EUD64396.1 hypothetical protein C922_05217 [Plasmodium inui San Antonio 1]